MKENRKARRGEEAFWRDLTENWMDVNHLHRTILERKLNQNGLYRSQHQLLMYISDHPNQSQKEIASDTEKTGEGRLYSQGGR